MRGLQLWEAMAHIIAALTSFTTGDSAGTAAALPRLRDAAEALGDGLFVALSRSVLAEAQAATGDFQAFKTIAESDSLARRSGALYGLAEIQRRGTIFRRPRLGDSAAAEAAFRRALATARGPGCPLLAIACCARPRAALG